MKKLWIILDKEYNEVVDEFHTEEEAKVALENLLKEDSTLKCEVRKLQKFTVDQWIHAHFCTEVYALDFENAKELVDGCDDTHITFDDLDVGDSGISCIYDENDNEYWCE